MRLAVFTNEFPTRVNTFFARDIRALIEMGIEPHVFSIYPPSEDLWQYVPAMLDESVLPRDRIHHVRLSESLRAARWRSALGDADSRRELGRLHRSALSFGLLPAAKTAYVVPKGLGWAADRAAEFDHVLAYWGNYAGTCAYIFSRFGPRRLPLSILLHAGTDLYRDQVYLPEKLRAADNIFVVCDFNRQYLKKLYPEAYEELASKITVHHLGLDFASFPFRLNSRPKSKIIAVGRLVRAKGFDYLLKAAATVRAKGQDLGVELVGDGEEKDELRHLAEQLGLKERVVFRGWLRPEEASEAISNATLLVHPSPMLGDAVPTVIKEAMALGTPVVASRIAGIPELLDDGNCGTLVEPRDTQALATAIETMLSDDRLRADVARRARRFAEMHFDMWKNGRILAGRLRAPTLESVLEARN